MAFVNFSNHPSTRWSEDQLKAAREYGDVFDVPFPTVPASATADEVLSLAAVQAVTILALRPDIVLVQGEMTTVFAVVSELQAAGIHCCAACSDRLSEERVLPDVTTEKVSTFKFIQFREYPECE